MRSFVRISLVTLVSFFAAFAGAAQQNPGHRPLESAQAGTADPGDLEGGEADKDERRWHSRVELALTIGTLAFGAVVLGMLGWFLGKGYLPAEAFLKLFVLVIVVTAGLFVVTAGYTQDQIAPMMGLLGTLVGYLLGREASRAAVAAAKAGGEPEL